MDIDLVLLSSSSYNKLMATGAFRPERCNVFQHIPIYLQEIL